MLDDEDATPELWEHQGQRLTVGWLRDALRELPSDMVVKLSLYDGQGIASMVDPVEVGLAGTEPETVVLTGAPIVTA